MVRNRLDPETPDKKTTTTNTIKETSIKIWRLLLSLVLFISGIVIGLISSSHITLTPNHSPSSLSSSFYNSYAIVNHSTNPNHTTHNLNLDFNLNNPSFDDMIHPKELIHSMSDDELFWRASMVPRINGFPFNRVKKVAFMFLTRGALPFLPLWERFFGGYDALFSIYVHTPPGFILNVSPDSVFFARQIPSKRVYWGDVTMADAEKRLLANALLDFSNERFVLISESCIPIYNFKTVYKYLTESVHSFVESYDDPTRYGRGRYNRRMLPDIKLYQWRKGSQWFEMSRTIAVEIISDYKYYDLFRKYCHPSCYPDEHYISTYINMFLGPLNSNRTVTYVDWSLGGPHPANFGRENITESFIQKIRNNGTECLYNSERTTLCYLFARKFDPSALEPLLDLSSKVMGF
ncbi:glycosyltransferase BC10 [Silene latifolia]|uniref:glycosyltransferase BC10 n=1 Tax=Silene latifolia TaxID=37657 RepID=UPI003D77783B